MTMHAFAGERRKGAAAVEASQVLLALTVFVFGIFEYGWFLMNYNVLNNAAREGCRYALVNNTSTTISTDVTAIVTNFMAGKDANFTNFTVSVSGTHAGATVSNVNNLVAGDFITVTVSGQYHFLNIIPLVKMPTSVTINSSVTMICEGAM
jgi:Flp pilus assembly protein TadG